MCYGAGCYDLTMTIHILSFELFDVFGAHFLQAAPSFQPRWPPHVLVSLLRPLNALRSHKNAPYDVFGNLLEVAVAVPSPASHCNLMCRFCIIEEGKVTNKIRE